MRHYGARISKNWQLPGCTENEEVKETYLSVEKCSVTSTETKREKN